MKRQFYHAHTVRYDECNCDGLLTPAAFLRYMQGIAALDAEDAQLSGNGYWVVRRSIISFTRPVNIHARLDLRTYAMGFSRIAAQRGYEAYIAGTDDTPVITARTLWIYLDPRGRPIRLPERTGQIWLPDGPQPPQTENPLPAFPDWQPDTTTSMVRFSDIDLMRHMNNASIVETLDNAAWQSYNKQDMTPDTAQLLPQSYDIEYIDSPYFRDTLEIQSWLDPHPSPGQEFSRFQQIIRGDKVMVRAHSRWLWQTNTPDA